MNTSGVIYIRRGFQREFFFSRSPASSGSWKGEGQEVEGWDYCMMTKPALTRCFGSTILKWTEQIITPVYNVQADIPLDDLIALFSMFKD